MDFGGCLNDDSFGPAAVGCRGDFDFTLKFERIFLSLLPAAIFIALSITRIVFLCRRRSMVGGAAFQWLKLTTIGAYAAVELSLLVMSAAKAVRLRELFISSSALTFITAICMVAVSFLEHSRSPRPSILLSSYLVLTLLFDVVQTRTLWLAARNNDEISFSRLTTAAVALKALMTFLESQHKTRWVQWDVKQHSPEETTGIYGLAAFIWLNSLFLNGYKKLLTLDDLFPLDQNMTSEALQARLANIMEKSTSRGGKFGLAKALAKTLAVPILIPVAPRIAMIGFTFCQPFLIDSVLTYLQQPTSQRDPNVGYGLIGASLLIYSGIALSTAFYWYFHERVLFMARGCLASAVYKKTTESKAVADDSAAVTLMSTDVERIRQGFLTLHEYWANTVEVALASWLLQRQLGAAFAAPIVVVVICIILCAALVASTGNRQKVWMDKIQRRVGMTAGVIANMKSVKIAGIAGPIEDLIQGMRVDELKMGNRFRMVMVISVTIAFAPLIISPVVTFAVTAASLDVTTIFTAFSYLLLLSNPLIMVLQMVPTTLAAFTCLTRIQNYLESEPRVDFRESTFELSDEKQLDGPGPSAAVITVKNGSFGWDEERLSLRNIDLAVPASQLTMVVGPIASGKSTLCRVLLGETPVHHGHVILTPTSRRIGYCDQNPFLSNGTIRENIVSFSPFNEARYSESIEATMLTADLLTLPQGDRTNIGSNGITLSGGQKQRVAMARALYLDTDFFIFDDILSGLDADTEENVFRRVFGPDGLMRKRNATAVLCTHSIRHLPSADHIIALGSDGTLVEQGNFQDLVANRKYVHSLGIKERKSEDSDSDATSVEIEEPPENPTFRAKTAESAVSEHIQDLARVHGDSTVYKHYFKSIGFLPLFSFLVTAGGAGFLYNWMTVWLNLWANDLSSTHPNHNNAYWIGLFGLFQAMAMILIFAFVFIGMRTIIMQSGATLHKAALVTVVKAPLRFFTTTDTGVVTNIFSQDMTLIDNELPMALLNVTVDFFITTGMAAVVASASPYLAISYPFLAVVLWCIQKFYLRTSRQLRLLDLEAKSPLYTHYLDTIKGVATFRAFGWVRDGILLNNSQLDNSQRPAYLLAMIQRWLGFTLDVVVCILAVIVVALSTQMRSTTGFTGASLVTLMSFGSSVANIIRSYTMLETSLGAISRLKSFSEKTKPETLPGEDFVPPATWPQNGSIDIKGVSASYSELSDDSDVGPSGSTTPNSPNLALRDLNITILPGEKVAICGRSGSGKSSTILLLLRLLDPIPSTYENVTIDGEPLHRIDRAVLRQRIIAVPQEAVFLPDGTSFRANLDPFGTATAADCRAALDAVGLSLLVDSHGGLDTGMSAEALSQGQKQLFSLARALLRRRLRAATGIHGGILLLDEVSSSVDMDTDRAMREVIEREFEGYTIVMVSHRLEMVMGFDRVVVMSRGEVVEQGRPRKLVEREGGRFRELWMVSSTGRE
ncbi:Multidrug resistance-associated protein 1 [Pleurostoma richardsiae]|uniref:Multidrug resistance-associated protein 1 n=1 Tax=Pleurostoma richardsiae TaxID=41990 RepID=A0AA38RME6_9PEZI|nr:Multidrug resistance-associated protein 1 [Pleurostoma richardsiae]